MRRRSLFHNFILLLFCLAASAFLLSCGEEKAPEIPEVDYSVSGTRDNTPRVMIPVQAGKLPEESELVRGGGPMGTLLGNSAVYFFNRIPPAWLTDYGEEPSEELKDMSTQRIKSVPYKYVFTGLFIAIGIYMGVRDPALAIPVLFSLWLLLLMSIADIKYMIVPDQLIMLLVLTGLGFLPQKVALYHRHAVYDSLIGAAAGLLIMLVIALLSRAIYKKWVLGGADIIHRHRLSYRPLRSAHHLRAQHPLKRPALRIPAPKEADTSQGDQAHGALYRNRIWSLLPFDKGPHNRLYYNHLRKQTKKGQRFADLLLF